MTSDETHIDRMPQTEMAMAAQLAVDQMKSAKIPVADYRLVEAVNVLEESPALWRMKFKLRGLIPRTAGEEIGKGGEVLIEVDMAAHSARVTGMGE